MNLCITPHFTNIKLIPNSPKAEKFRNKLHINDKHYQHQIISHNCSCKTNDNCDAIKFLSNGFQKRNRRQLLYQSPEIEELHIGDVCEKLYIK